jgi:hypothetical protein
VALLFLHFINRKSSGVVGLNYLELPLHVYSPTVSVLGHTNSSSARAAKKLFDAHAFLYN